MPSMRQSIVYHYLRSDQDSSLEDFQLIGFPSTHPVKEDAEAKVKPTKVKKTVLAGFFLIKEVKHFGGGAVRQVFYHWTISPVVSPFFYFFIFFYFESWSH